MNLKSWSHGLAAAAGAFLAMAATAARAQTQTQVVFLTAPGALFPSGMSTLGFEFNVPVPDGAFGVFVFALGVFDAYEGPLHQDATVGLWDTSGDLLTSVVVPAGGGVSEGFFRYASIAPFYLTSGQDYIVGAYQGGDGLATSLNTPQGGVGTYRIGVSVVEDRFSGPSAFAFPDQTAGFAGGAWLGANLDLGYAVPEPASWSLMLVGIGALGLALRRSSWIGKSTDDRSGESRA